MSTFTNAHPYDYRWYRFFSVSTVLKHFLDSRPERNPHLLPATRKSRTICATSSRPSTRRAPKRSNSTLAMSATHRRCGDAMPGVDYIFPCSGFEAGAEL